MGAYESSYVVTQKETIKSIKPTHSEWIFRHAEAVDMPISQVQRCWRRFLAMGCDKNGCLTQKSNIWKAENIVVQQILKKLPWSKNSLLTFQAYLKVCKWFAGSDEITKLKVLFYVINEGNSLNQNLLQRFFRRVYPENNPEELKELLQKFMSAVDYKNQGFIDEEDFIRFARTVPYAKISSTLTFEVIPRSVYLD